MLVIYGLGNFGPKYRFNRHNVGKLVVEKIVQNLNWVFSSSSQYSLSKGQIIAPVYLLYSTGFMNNSGLPLLNFLQYFKIDLKNMRLLIIQDDSDQISCKQKLVQGGGSGGHHGINSIFQHLLVKKEDIWRLKIGIRPQNNKQKSETFVLNDLSAPELNYIDDLAQKMTFLLPDLVQKDLIQLQNSLN